MHKDMSLLSPPAGVTSAITARLRATQRVLEGTLMPRQPYRSRLYFIAETESPHGCSLSEQVQAALAGGAGLVQYHPSNRSAREMTDEATELVWHCRRQQVPLIVNGRVDVALAAGAEGVHLGGRDIPVALARRLMGPHAIIGVAVSGFADALQAERQGATYIAVGPIFRSAESAAEPVGLGALLELQRAVSLPVCAMGGITLENAAQLTATPAAMIAVSSSLLRAPDLRQAADSLVQRLQTAPRALPLGRELPNPH